MSKKTPVWRSCPGSCLAFGKIKGVVVDHLVFLLIMSDLCGIGSNTEVSVLLASAAAPTERTDCGEAGSSWQDSGTEAAVSYSCRGRCAPNQRKKEVLVEVALPDGHLYSSSCSGWHNRVGRIFQAPWYF